MKRQIIVAFALCACLNLVSCQLGLTAATAAAINYGFPAFILGAGLGGLAGMGGRRGPGLGAIPPPFLPPRLPPPFIGPYPPPGAFPPPFFRPPFFRPPFPPPFFRPGGFFPLPPCKYCFCYILYKLITFFSNFSCNNSIAKPFVIKYNTD